MINNHTGWIKNQRFSWVKAILWMRRGSLQAHVLHENDRLGGLFWNSQDEITF